jgi:putative endonuclease
MKRERSVADWYVYIVRCADGSLYTGIARDVQRRLNQHNGAVRGGARYTRGRRPVELVYQEDAAGRVQAARREWQIKGLNRRAKETLVRDWAERGASAARLRRIGRAL